MSNIFDELDLALPEEPKPSRRADPGGAIHAPKMRALAQRVLASEHGIRIKHPDIKMLQTLRHRFYQWRMRNRHEPGYDKTLDLFTLTIKPIADGYALDIKVFTLDDYDIEELPPL
jgi:hypothetical protein